MKPQEIKQKLDDFVVGQDEVKKILAVSVYNHYIADKIFILRLLKELCSLLFTLPFATAPFFLCILF